MNITEQQINLIGRRLNNQKELGDQLTDLYTEAQEEGLTVTDEQAAKGFAWLLNLYKSPTGKVRVSNPYGTREESALDSGLKAFTYDGHFDAGNAYHSWYAPLYTFIGKNGLSFQYYVSAGGIQIIG